MSKYPAFHRKLHRWYQTHGRKDLPWRNTSDPYAIYVSEIMLQQTQVATVLARYYHPFLERFPTLEKLAAASPKEVLSAWQGLGYYNRAINLHKAAKQCTLTLPLSLIGRGKRGKAAQVKVLPATIDELIKLPGIGRNTAHAVAAFAFRQPVAVMEANVKRVISRIFALTHPSTDELWEKAHSLLDTKNPFDYNQAMMDIGATVCTRRRPQCAACPAGPVCKGKAAPESYPAPKTRKAMPVRQKTIIVLQNGDGKYFARPRASKFLNGLYHFLEMDSSSRRKPGSGIKNTCMPAFTGVTKIGHIRQQYSHFTLEADVHLASGDGRGRHWHSLDALKKLPFSRAEQKILELIA